MDEREHNERSVMELMTAPTNGDRPLPKRTGMKSMLPSSWLGNLVEVTYAGPDNEVACARGVYVDHPMHNILLKTKQGSKLVIYEQRICTVELVED